MKIISFSLWGDNPMYTKGAIENILLAKKFYQDWVCRFYVNNTVSLEVISNLLKNGAEVYTVPNNLGLFWGMFWRFFANDDKDVDVFISRDCDSRLSCRERAAVQEWENSNKTFHTMHDHFAHRSVPVLGGMWGAKRGCITNIMEKIYRWGEYNQKGIDQNFLWKMIWPEVYLNSLNHSSLEKKYNTWAITYPFPDYYGKEVDTHYVGEIFDENNNPVKS